MPICGGTSEAKKADAEVQSICDKVRPDLEGKADRKFPEFTAVSVKTQVVAGTNYFVKIHVGNEDYLHVRIFKPLPHAGEGPQVHSFLLSKSKDEEIAYF